MKAEIAERINVQSVIYLRCFFQTLIAHSTYFLRVDQGGQLLGTSGIGHCKNINRLLCLTISTLKWKFRTELYSCFM